MEESLQTIKKSFPQLQFGIPLKDHTTLEIGGPAKAFVEVHTPEELTHIVTLATQHMLPFLIIGGGSNLLVSDQGFEGLIIKNSLKRCWQEEGFIKVLSGTLLQNLVDFTIEHGFSGVHKMTGIPGTVGGALYGNAGAYGQTISDHLVTVVCLDPQTQKQIILTKEECKFSYRESDFKDNHLIIIEAHFQFNDGNPSELKDAAGEILRLRQQKYKPGIKCPGSFFKNVLSDTISPEIRQKLPEYKDTYGKIPAWLFLDEVGAKGQRLGNIEVASFHGNLFINLGEGTAQDFWTLASKYFHKVKDAFGIELEPEVQLINLPPFNTK